MSQTVVPMIHVPDVSATVNWYTSVGFKVVRRNEEDGETNWAKLSFWVTFGQPVQTSSSLSLDVANKNNRSASAAGIEDLN